MKVVVLGLWTYLGRLRSLNFILRRENQENAGESEECRWDCSPQSRTLLETRPEMTQRPSLAGCGSLWFLQYPSSPLGERGWGAC